MSGGLMSGGLMSGGLMSGGLMSGGLTSGGLTSGGLMSGGLKSYDQISELADVLRLVINLYGSYNQVIIRVCYVLDWYSLYL